MLKAALAIIAFPPALWFTAKSIERPFHVILLAFIGYSLIGYFLILDLFSLFQFFVILGMGLLILYAATGRSFTISRAFLWEIIFPMTAFLLLGAFSLRLAREPEISYVYLRNYLGSLVFAFLVYSFTTSEKDVKLFGKIMVVVLLANAVMGIIQLVTANPNMFPADFLVSGGAQEMTATSTSPKPRGFYFMAFEYSKDLLFAVMPIMAMVVMGYRTRWRPVLLVVLGLGIVAIATSQVRSTQIGFVLGLIYIMVRALQHAPRKGAILVRAVVPLLLIAAVMGAYIAANPYLIARYTLGDYSMFFRITLVSMGMAIIRKHWLWGVGLGNFKAVYFEYLPSIFQHSPAFTQKSFQPHNVFIDMWTGAGVFAVAAYFAMFVLTFFALDRVRRWSPSLYLRTLSVGFQAFLIGYFVECLFHNHIFDNNYWLLIGMSYAMLAMTRKATQSADSAQPGIPRP